MSCLRDKQFHSKMLLCNRSSHSSRLSSFLRTTHRIAQVLSVQEIFSLKYASLCLLRISIPTVARSTRCLANKKVCFTACTQGLSAECSEPLKVSDNILSKDLHNTCDATDLTAKRLSQPSNTSVSDKQAIDAIQNVSMR